MTDKSFNQVKNILGKLDRSIDELRSRRSTPQPAAAGAAVTFPLSPASGTAVAPSQNSMRQADPIPAPAPEKSPVTPPAPPARGAQFGRATPILPKQA